MTRVAVLVSYPIMPAKMGGQKGIYLFLKFFCRHCDIVCYTTKNNEPADNEPFPVKKVLSNHRLRYVNPLYFFRLRKEFRNDGITHLLLEQPYYGWLAFLLKKALGIKLILHSHNIEAMRFRSTGKWWWPIMSWYEGTVHRMAHFNFFVTAEDMEYALKNYRLDREKCAVTTFGTESDRAPSRESKETAKKELCRQHAIPGENLVLLYNGTLDYPPNRKGLDYILQEINPLLLQQQAFPYTIIICGNRLAKEYNELQNYRDRHIIFAGFVKDIDSYFRGADIFINPIVDGGGIKTKLVEALAAGCSAVSFHNGAIGVPVTVTGNKLQVVGDRDFNAFAAAILQSTESVTDSMPASYYDHFYWDNITRKAAAHIKSI